jgi:hypothetical protein
MLLYNQIYISKLTDNFTIFLASANVSKIEVKEKEDEPLKKDGMLQ